MLLRQQRRNGELSNSACGGGSSRPPESSDSIQCTPERSMLAASTWKTCGDVKVGPDVLERRHRALPAECLGREHGRRHRAGGGADDDGKGIAARRGSISVIALSTPT